MYITKRHISRRTVLRGMGAAISLPFLEAMVPAQTPLRKSAAVPKSRLACVEIVHGSAGSTPYGTDANLWMPAKEGSDFEFTPILKPLEPLREYITVLTMMDNAPAEAVTPEEVGADHFRSSAVFLTASHPKRTEGSDVYCGTSIDQLYAQKFGQDTPLPSIQLCIENFDGSGTCAFRYSCVYSDTISWSSPRTPLPMTLDPRLAFEQLFGDGGSAEDRAARRSLNRSILDGVTHVAARLKKNLDARDRVRLDTYLDNVREIERRIEAVETYNKNNPKRELPTAPIGVPDSWEDHTKLMFDLQVLAFASEVTRSSAMKMSKDAVNRVFPESGNSSPFHSASHHAEYVPSILELSKINRYHVAILSYFLNKLKNTPDGDGNLLDHTLVFYGSPMGNSNTHNHKRIPVLIAGHASGQIRGNLHLRFPEGTPQANALLTMMKKLGVDIDHFGDSTGAIEI